MNKQQQLRTPLAIWLKAHGMTQWQFAVKIGVGENMAIRYIHGTSVPTGIRLERVTKLTGLTGAQLEAGRTGFR